MVPLLGIKCQSGYKQGWVGVAGICKNPRAGEFLQIDASATQAGILVTHQ
ncbi:hypothetical protein GGR28_003754 [Lewinella aquimaris]|uniref:Uncharacterized protein n=1 Tax=Neolewinella aquimaris TaxID=1835722 RepID=A0A840ECA6_9BACT|nr:hypothetical protein [Neolewinella aquimaris]